MPSAGPHHSSAGIMRFSSAAQNVLLKAHVEAVHQGSALIQPAHMLLALAAEEHGAAGQVLRENRITAEVVQRLLGPRKEDPPATVNLSPGVQKILEQALRAAREEGANEIGTAQLLTGLLETSDAFVQQAFQVAFTTPEEIRDRLERRGGED